MRARGIRARILQSIAACGLLAVAVLTAWAFVPEKASEPPDPSQQRAIKRQNWKHQKVCPAGHETELVMGQTHLFVDLQTIWHLGLDDAQEVPEGCPTAAILVERVSFPHFLGTNALEALFQRLNLPLNDLELVRMRPGYHVGPETIGENPDGRITVDGLGTVEDITQQHRKSLGAQSRAYRLRHHTVTGAAPAVIFMLCHERPDEQACETIYRYGDMRVAYQFDLDRSVAPDELLAVDARVRGWIEIMLHHRDGI